MYMYIVNKFLNLIKYLFFQIKTSVKNVYKKEN